MTEQDDRSGSRGDADLLSQVAFLEQEVAVLRRRLTEAPRHSRQLEDRIVELQTQLSGTSAQNERLVATLREAREQIVALKEEVDRLAQPPSGYGVFLSSGEDGTVDVFTGGRKLRVAVSPDIDVDTLQPGREVMLNEALNVVRVMDWERLGDVVMLKEIMEDGERALVIGHTDEERVVYLAEPLRNQSIRVGDSLLLEPRSGYVYERVPKAEVEELVLEEVPDIDYTSIGGLSSQIEMIRDAVELPYLHRDLFIEHKLRPPKGILLYGPPGCGKTLIAKAVANSLAKKVAEHSGKGEGKSYFLNIKGPELLNKYVGETERHIRLVFQRAREKASEGTPVIVFFDEMDSLFRTRGSGVSSDVENTIVPQLLSEIDGVEGLENVVVIGASNREDMIDPAILRPGRLDVKIKIERPDAEAAKDIFGKYIIEDLPLHAD
ncbi:MAG TPA: proteasome ATPase, partial [Sporichthya sp.]|nr:proteasome ATPase [Sporichthya sp.]